MKTLLMAIAATAAMTAQAASPVDTTFTVSGKRIVLTDSAGQTRVSVYSTDSSRLTRTYETSYVDGQEIERVYISSPFIPQTVGRKKRSPKAHYPLFFMGFNTLQRSAFSTGGNPAMHTRDSKSWEWGITCATMACRLTSGLALTSACQMGRVHHHFQGNYVLSTTDGATSMRLVDDGDVRKSYISYGYMRIPLMIEWQSRTGGDDLFVALGPSVEMRWKDHSRYYVGDEKRTETSDTNINPLGLNLELRMGYRYIVVYGRAALTPLLKTVSAPKCYQLAFGLGVRI